MALIYGKQLISGGNLDDAKIKELQQSIDKKQDKLSDEQLETINNSYTSDEIDTKLQSKANASNVYSRSTLDEKFDEIYTKIEALPNITYEIYE